MDVDLPINADFDDIKCDQLAYSLPGETTRMEPFIRYIQLSQIMSRCLQQMYTTTDRRGAVGKIQLLQRELDVWKQNLESCWPDVALIAESANNNLGATVDYILLWFHLMELFTSVLIHRPALTFTPQEPQFKNSLGACVQAATKIIASFQYGQDQHLLTRMWPSGYHLVLQSAMVILYSSWVGRAESFLEDAPSANQMDSLILMGFVHTAVDLLNPKHDSEPSADTTAKSPVPEATSELRQTAFFLQHLHSQSVRSQSPGLGMDTLMDHPVDVSISNHLDTTSPTETPSSFNQPAIFGPIDSSSAAWTPLSIDGVNQMEPFELMDSFLVPWGD